MKVLVCVKRVVDYNVKVRAQSDGRGVDLDNVKMSMNPFDEIAVEEAVRLKEQGKVSQIILVTIGSTAAQDVLRTGLAIGADRAILVKADQSLESLNVAKILKIIALEEHVELILMGKQAIDDDNNQTGQMLAALLNWPQATFASKIDLHENFATVNREVDGGIEVLQLNLPAVITTDLRLNEPRFTTLPNIMKARKILIEEKQLDSFNLNLNKRLIINKVEEPTLRKEGIKIENVFELVDKLKSIIKTI